jgi:NAD(P)-dependent dehydrogenase (short-subunit alcohol dehydrogenase family)
MLSQMLASKLTKLGVRVNSIAVGNIPSEINDKNNPQSFIEKSKNIIPIGRVGNEEDVAGAVVYLASRAGSFVSGACIKVRSVSDLPVLVYRCAEHCNRLKEVSSSEYD